jgi:hypothetical protein
LRENFDRFNSQIYKEKEMADFRRCIFAFAVVALLLGLLPTASAQVNGVTCTANAAVPPTLRAEGLTELAGDIVLNCSGGTPAATGSVLPQANFQVFFNTQVTSRLLNSSNQSEAILTIDEPTAAQVVACTNLSGGTGGSGACPGVAAGAGGVSTEFKNGFNSNLFTGIVAGNSVIFTGIPIDAPGTTTSRIFRITNVRVNANAVSAPGANGVPGQVIGLISVTPATNPGGQTPTFSVNNPQVTVAFVQTSLTTSITGTVSGKSPAIASDIAILQCVGRGASASVGQLNYTELFPTAFKTHTVIGSGITAQNVLGLVYNSESGYYNPALPSPLVQGGTAAAGLADFGTRLRAVFNNIPNGVSIFVSVNNTVFASTANPVSGTSAQLVSSETTIDGTTGFTPVSATTTTIGGGIFQIPIVNGTGEANWEVVAANPLTSQTYSFTYYAVATASPATNSPAIGTGTVNLWYSDTAPQAFTAANGGIAQNFATVIPRFVDSSTATNAVAVTICRTNILYPYVTSQAGFDTGLAIANTSTDPFGTAAQAGPCNLFFYGTNAPASVTTPSVASGTVYSNLATTLAPNFTGYVIALCNFQYAHGFAFISDVGARNLAMGYLALIIPDPASIGRQAAAFECGQGTGVAAACDNSGEELSN